MQYGLLVQLLTKYLLQQSQHPILDKGHLILGTIIILSRMCHRYGHWRNWQSLEKSFKIRKVRLQLLGSADVVGQAIVIGGAARIEDQMPVDLVVRILLLQRFSQSDYLGIDLRSNDRLIGSFQSIKITLIFEVPENSLQSIQLGLPSIRRGQVVLYGGSACFLDHLDALEVEYLLQLIVTIGVFVDLEERVGGAEEIQVDVQDKALCVLFCEKVLGIEIFFVGIVNLQLDALGLLEILGGAIVSICYEVVQRTVHADAVLFVADLKVVTSSWQLLAPGVLQPHHATEVA